MMKKGVLGRARGANPNATRRSSGRRAVSVRAASPSSSPASSATEAQSSSTRYIAMNRFQVQERDGAAAAFEKKWALRPSRLATMDGFRWFSLFRKVAEDGSGPVLPTSGEEFNYTSMTVWENKDNFTVWREGDAFKEAHGGGTFKGVLDMLVTTAGFSPNWEPEKEDLDDGKGGRPDGTSSSESSAGRLAPVPKEVPESRFHPVFFLG